MLTIGPIALILFAVGISLIVGFVVVANSSYSSHGHGATSVADSADTVAALRPGAMAAYVPRASAAPAEAAPADPAPAPAAPAPAAPPGPTYSRPPAFGTAAPLATSVAPEPTAEPLVELPVAEERRDFARQSLARPVYLRRGTPDAPPVRSFAFNISAGGVLLAGPADLRLGESVWMELDLQEGSGPVHATGTVVHQTANGHKGLGFDFVAPDDRAMLARLSQDLHAERAGSAALA